MSTPENADEQSEAVETQVNTFIRYDMPPYLPSHYAQHFIIQPQENEVVLSFFEVMFPPLSGTPEMQAETRRRLVEGGIPAQCVTRVTIPFARFPFFVRAMQDSLEKIRIVMEGGTPDESQETTTGQQVGDDAAGDGKENP